MKTGYQAGTKTFKVHLGWLQLHCPTSRATRRRARATPIYYFDQGGNLNAIRWNDWKVSFAVASRRQHRDGDCARCRPGR